MAIFRKIHVQFWGDSYIQSLTPEQKFFFLYLLTNERTRQCGIYEITPRQISFDTGYTVETVLHLIDFFTESGKIVFSRETSEMAIKNWDRYNSSRSPDIKALVNKELASIKNPKLIEWLQSADTVLPDTKISSRGEREREREKEPEEEGERDWSAHGMLYDAEKAILGNMIWFEGICANARNGTTIESAKESLRKFHLYLK